MGKAELRIEIDQALLDEARALNIDVEALTVESLRAILDEKRVNLASAEKARQWASENAEAIALHRERIDRHGVFGEDVRTW
ncbi:type II toxin-antitoxin system CcdA family antitoxin [Brevundimonas sp.]|uniref:type II toxin-antitoxin system CcdA family antitoxin n=1 Tax=Brevundimonas sp. TaxID=1871086 RepID=UPI001D96498A|nr:type II toxin-antitoxin system CcdA family antitoxin [Brevundimonas sp.]MBL0947552.1 type II toxin-antitoxin system CcdA family antitoxin [Brevundimonas sp.]